MKDIKESRVYKIAESLGLLQVSDPVVISGWVDTVFEQNQKAVKDKAVSFLVGRVMKLSNNKANAVMAKKMIEERINAIC